MSVLLAGVAKSKFLARWLEEAERIWNKVRGEKKEKLTVYERLDYQRLLSTQSSKAKYRVVYLTSATYLAACVVNNAPLDVSTQSGPVKINGIIIDATLYRYDTDNEDEAYYLASVFNSSVLDELIKLVQAKGQFGHRHIHKKPLEFPIPRYDPNNSIHRRLCELGKMATQEAYRVLPDILRELGYDTKLKQREYLEPQEVGRIRSAIREVLSDILREIDNLVVEVLMTSSREETGLSKWLKPKEKWLHVSASEKVYLDE